MLIPSLDSSRSTCLIACLVTRPRARARPWPIVLTAREAVLMTPRVALVNDRIRLACRSTIEQAVKEAVDFPKAKGLVPSHRLAPRIMVAYAEIRDLPARGNQSMTCAEYKSTQAC